MSVQEEIEQSLAKIHEKMDSWTSLIREARIPNDVMVALSTGRPELLKLVKPRPLNDAEFTGIVDLLGNLLDTNAALQQHAALIAKLVDMAFGNLRGLNNTIQRIRSFAEFQNPSEDDDDEC